MKKQILIVLFAISTFYFANAQEVGVRLGNVSGGPVAIDGVFGLGKFSRIHADISFGNDGVGIDALWDFLYKPLGDEAFNWYAGVGPYIVIGNPFWLGVAGEIGLEYRFKEVPIALGFDYRPELSIIETTEFHFDSYGINVRYRFGK